MVCQEGPRQGSPPKWNLSGVGQGLRRAEVAPPPCKQREAWLPAALTSQPLLLRPKIAQPDGGPQRRQCQPWPREAPRPLPACLTLLGPGTQWGAPSPCCVPGSQPGLTAQFVGTVPVLAHGVGGVQTVARGLTVAAERLRCLCHPTGQLRVLCPHSHHPTGSCRE